MNKFITLPVFMLAITWCSSCKKGDSTTMRPANVDSVKIFGLDSTQLIKSISTIGYDSFNVITGSFTSYVYYDTLNKKVIFSSQYVSSPSLAYFENELSYNSSGLISQQKYNTAGADTGDVVTIDYTYDAQNILSSETTTYVSGNTETFHLTKASLPSGGYSLTTKSSLTDFVYDSILNVYDFDAAGRLVLRSGLELPGLNADYIDSTIYDASGNITKVIETALVPGNPTTSYSLFEFSSRDTKGNQLYNFNKLLYNGIFYFPTAENNIDLGGDLNGYDNYYLYQFTMNPSLNTKVYRQDTNSYLTYNPAPQYDSQNRLVKYKMFNGDSPDFYEEFDIVYYK